jgi:ribose-phosphate pyrophosphokinase
MANTHDMKVFSGSTSVDFARRICDHLGLSPGVADVVTFSEGNTFVRIGETVRGHDVYIVQSLGVDPNNEFVELLFWLDAFKRASANSVTVVMPYFSYAKGDKKDEPRVSIRARVCAECMELAGADRVVTMDLHSPQIQGFFKKPVDHLIARSVLVEYIRNLNIEDLMVVSPDAGFAKQARKFAGLLGVPVAIGDKNRSDHSEQAEVLEIIGDVTDKNCLIVDDFSISGGTLVHVATALRKRGAKRVMAALSHMLFTEAATKIIADSELEFVVGTDSVSNPHIKNQPKFKVVSVAPLFAQVISRIHQQESVSSLFDG